VHITYQSAFVDDEGKLQVRDDVYGATSACSRILKGSERKMADIVHHRAEGLDDRAGENASGHPSAAVAACSAGPSFFDRLFGAPEPAPKPRARVGSANGTAQHGPALNRASLETIQSAAAQAAADLLCGGSYGVSRMRCSVERSETVHR